MAPPSLPSLDRKTPSDAASGDRLTALTPPTPTDGTNWIVAPCGTVGCQVMIRWRVREFYHPTCKWCRSGAAYYVRGSRTEPHDGVLLSKEEFGLDLFEAITLHAGIRQAEHSATVYTRKGLALRVTETDAKVGTMQKQMKTILDRGTIDGPDLQRLLAIT